ncbi:MAG: hypothetical protein KAJ46_06950 [Sedimentisphaerales bacterium]|nr:hypothetical protein [Sedimentisphaerales bacterium]
MWNSCYILAELFSQPLYVPTNTLSLLWALPICLSIAVVYKAIKMETMRPKIFVREVLLLFVTIIGFLSVVAVGLLGVACIAGQF